MIASQNEVRLMVRWREADRQLTAQMQPTTEALSSERWRRWSSMSLGFMKCWPMMRS